jgi:hypothetical protein
LPLFSPRRVLTVALWGRGRIGSGSGHARAARREKGYTYVHVCALLYGTVCMYHGMSAQYVWRVLVQYCCCRRTARTRSVLVLDRSRIAVSNTEVQSSPVTSSPWPRYATDRGNLDRQGRDRIATPSLGSGRPTATLSRWTQEQDIFGT